MSTRWFQSPGEPHEGVTHASRSEFCLVVSLIVFRATPAENVWPPHSKSVRSQVSTALQTITFAYKQRLGDVISVKTLVRQLPGLPDLLCHPCADYYKLGTTTAVSSSGVVVTLKRNILSFTKI